MSYREKFNRLKEILYANKFAQTNKQPQFNEFLDHYSKASADRSTYYRAVQLTSFVDAVSKDLTIGKITERAAYLKLLGRCIALVPHEAVRSFVGAKVVESELKFSNELSELLNAADYQHSESSSGPATLPLIDIHEKRFVFLCGNAGAFIPQQTLVALMNEVYTEKMSVAEGNWLIAVALYEEYKKREHAKQSKRKPIIEGLLLGYLHDRMPDCMDFRKDLIPRFAPTPIGDYLFMQMTEAAIASVDAKAKPTFGPYKDTLWKDIVTLKRRYGVADQPLLVEDVVPARGNGGYQAGDIVDQSVKIKPPEAYDLYLKKESSVFLDELNNLYRKLENPNERTALRSFVRKLNLLDKKTREMQAKLVQLKSLQGDEELHEKYAQKLNHEVVELRRKIEEDIPLLKKQLPSLLGTGKPGSLMHKIIGIGLLVIFGITLGLSVLSLLLMPPAAFTATVSGFMLTNKIIAIVAAVSSSVGMGIGGITLFKGREIKPASIATAAGNMITFIETKARKACAEVSEVANEYNYKGFSQLYQ
jgi:hypothetical protein